MSDPRLAIGGNRPPTLAEELAEETAADLARTNDLVKAANNAVVANAEDQQKVAGLGGLILSHAKLVEGRRVARKKPFDDDAAAVQRAYRPMLDLLTEATKRLRSLNDQFEARLEQEREAERRRLREEEARRLKEAEDARRRAEEERQKAPAGGGGGLEAELEAIAAEDAALRAAQEREAIRAEPVRTDAGSASRTTVRSWEIVGLTECLAFLRRSHRAALVEAVQPIVTRLGRAGVIMPGVETRETKSTRFGR